MTGTLDDRLRRWAAERRGAVPAVDIAALVRQRRVRPRWIAAASAAALVLAVAAAAIAVAVGHRSTTTSTGSAHSLVVRDGDTVTAQGEVVAAPGRPTVLCDTTTGSACTVRVTVTGIDLSRLGDRRVARGRTTGLSRISGTYRDGTIDVTEQTAYEPVSTLHVSGVPCSPPTGGWPQNTGHLDQGPVDRYRQQHPDAVVLGALLHPSSSQEVVYLLTAGGPGPIRSALTAALGGALCVVRSKYSAAELRTAEKELTAVRLDGKFRVVAVKYNSLSPAQQPAVYVYVPFMSDQLADVVDRQPDGLVIPLLFVTPVR